MYSVFEKLLKEMTARHWWGKSKIFKKYSFYAWLLDANMILYNHRKENKGGNKMKVKTFEINTTAGKRYGLVTTTGRVLTNATAKWKTEKGALNFAKKMGYETV